MARENKQVNNIVVEQLNNIHFHKFKNLLSSITLIYESKNIIPVPVLALPAPWARFLRHPLTAIQTHTKKGKGYNEITIY